LRLAGGLTNAKPPHVQVDRLFQPGDVAGTTQASVDPI